VAWAATAATLIAEEPAIRVSEIITTRPPPPPPSPDEAAAASAVIVAPTFTVPFPIN
jgi:hypothetical protein